MNPYHASRIAVVALISLLPICAFSAETGHDQAASENPAVSGEDLEKIGERIRQTGALIREDMKEAADQAATKELKQRQAQGSRSGASKPGGRAARTEQAERERQVALVAHCAREKQAARERAARALMEARQSAGLRAGQPAAVAT